MQALILAGGEGTRLRPLTTTVPKPVVPLVDRPFVAFMLDWLRGHGVTDVVMSCGHMASGVRNVLGDGSAFGVELRYVEEPRPLGTGGALKFAESLLEDRFLMLNGDVLTDLDLTAQMAQHEASGAVATLALAPVEDPSNYGLVRTAEGGAVTEFVEKPAPDQIDTRNISAGVYVLERSVLDMLAPEQPASIERDVFPQLVGNGLYGHVAGGYWLDIGTPERYLEATFDILEGTVGTHVVERLGEHYICVEDNVENEGRIIPSALVEARCRIRDGRPDRPARRARAGRHHRLRDDDRALGGDAGDGDRRQLHAARLHRRRWRAGRRRVPDRGPQRPRRGRHDRRRQHDLQRRPGLPRRHAARPRARVRMIRLDGAAVRAADPTGQVREMLDLPVHLRDALWRVDSAGIAPVDAPGGLVVAGMGGSAVGGRLALGALGPRLRRPLIVADGYALPAWVADDVLVLCSSYSGATEETLAAYDDAAARGVPRVVATTGGPLAERARRDGVPVIPLPGGFQPRAAVGYSLVAALEAAALAGAAPSVRDEVEAAATLAERLAAEWGPDGPQDGEAKALARRLHGRVAVITGAELAAPAAYRWKTQINENAELPAFASALPEADHNELVGWAAAETLAPFAAVLLEDPGAHPRNALRLELTAELAGAGGSLVERVTALGETPLERLVSLVLLGDLVSLYLAVLRGADPAVVDVLGVLKDRLASR